MIDTQDSQGLSLRSVLFLGWLIAVLFGCGELQTPPASKIVPISEFDKIAGEWEGLSKRLPRMQDHAQVTLTISKNGQFNFASDRSAGMVLGTGVLHLQDGVAIGRGSAGTGMFTLHDQAGKRVLVVNVVLNDGYHYFLEMV